MEKESGFILIDKPAGITSFGVIARLRKITGIKKIGHAGTLDPFATGLLIVAIGRGATREIDKYVKLDKEYEALIDLSRTTDTYDKEGKTTFEYKGKKIEKKELKEILKGFIGKQEQIPPMFSAKKVNGKKLYELARKGKKIKREPSDVEIYDIKLLEYTWPEVKIRTKVSSGTYIRALARDVGNKLKTGACLKELRRLEINGFTVKEAKSIEEIKEDKWKYLLF